MEFYKKEGSPLKSKQNYNENLKKFNVKNNMDFYKKEENHLN
jgi:hypothetical protein